MNSATTSYSPHASEAVQAAAETCSKSLRLITGSPLFDQLEPRTKTSSTDFAGVLPILSEELHTITKYENKSIDAGWTYFGQFLSHDLTIRRDLNDTKPRLNLECLYGWGPKSNAHLYEVYKHQADEYDFRGVRFVFDPYINPTGDKVDDVFRIGAGKNIPVMADVRNDDNFLINQLHCAFMRFHNRMAEYFHDELGIKQSELFRHTRQFVTRTYQWLIVNEYLPLLSGDVADGLISGAPAYKILKDVHDSSQGPVLLPEFILAALRIGHSQVREFYQLNKRSQDLPLYREKSLDLRGFVRDHRRGPVDWRFFFAFEGPSGQSSRPMDMMIAASLHQLPFLPKDDPDLAQINIRRSVDANMIIRDADLHTLRTKLGIDTLKSFQSALDTLYPTGWLEWPTYKAALLELDGWPLWLFILLEARILGTEEMSGRKHIHQQLGPLGAQIMAEQLVWILLRDPDSYLCQPSPWQPTDALPAGYVSQRKGEAPVTFSIADLLHIAEHGL